MCTSLNLNLFSHEVSTLENLESLESKRVIAEFWFPHPSEVGDTQTQQRIKEFSSYKDSRGSDMDGSCSHCSSS